MLLSFEIPLKHLLEYVPLEDFEFGLAHLFTKPDPVPEYIKLYQGCLLDNSMYELGAPMSTDALVHAADDAQAVAVIAPDWMDDQEKTETAFFELIDARPKTARWTVGGVVQGKNLIERKECYATFMAYHASPVCFPFRSPREETIPKLFRDNRLKEDQWYHLLGLRDLKELTWDPPGLWSCDTSKPFKGYRMDEKPIRGQGTINLESQLSLYAQRVAGWNISYMRRLTRDSERTRFAHYLQYRRRKHA